MIADGQIAPAFELATDGDGPVSLAAHMGRPVVLYFYPKDDTSGCTLEAQSFTALAKEFSALGATVIGISPDSAECHARFRKKYDLSVVLAADTDHAVADAYGVWAQKQMYGKTYMGIERSTFLIDRKGRIARSWRKVKVPGHAEAVLEAVRELG